MGTTSDKTERIKELLLKKIKQSIICQRLDVASGRVSKIYRAMVANGELTDS